MDISATQISGTMNINPWKGLNFYKEGEVLYGRDDEIQSLALYVINNTQTVLYGKSGIGKSSIINAGVFPIARKEGLFPIPIRLKHDSETPYISQIKAAFEDSNIGIREVLKPIDESRETLWEFLHRNRFYKKDNDTLVRPLIVFDQFEEIFTLQHDEKKKIEFFSELADLLNEVKPSYIATNSTKQKPDQDVQQKPDSGGFSFDFGVSAESEGEESADYIHESLFNIVFSIREDFLSYLERYTKYIPVMKFNRYALLPINEEQAKDIIMKPVEGLVDIDVAKLIIEKVTGKTDFNLGDAPEIEVDSAVLSLFLSRIYIKKGDNPKITAELVNISSKDIIKDFYEESVKDLPLDEIEKLEDLLLTHDNRRNNSSRNDLISEGISEKVLKTLVEKRKLLRQFSYQDDIRVEFMHDILCPVVKDRIEHREELAREKELLRLQEEERKKVEEERKLQAEKLAKAEEDRRKIELKALAEKQEMEEKARQVRIRNRKRIRAIIFAAFGIGLFALGMWFFLEYYPNKWVHEEFFANYEKINGWPHGVGKALTLEERLHTPLYYRLSHVGNKNGSLHTDVEIMSSNVFLPRVCRIPEIEWADEESIGHDSKARFLNSILTRVQRIHYSSNVGSNEISKEEYFDEDGNLLMFISYFHDATNSAWAQYYTANGQNLSIRDVEIDRKKLSWDENTGCVQSIMYYDKDGVRRCIDERQKVNGYLWESNNKDTVWRYSLNEFGLPTTGPSFNTIVSIIGEDTEEMIYALSKRVHDPNWEEVLSEEGYSRHVRRKDTIYYYKPREIVPFSYQVITRDHLGNIIRTHTFGDLSPKVPAIIDYDYLNGLLIKEEWLTDNEQCFQNADSLHTYRWDYSYDEKGRCIERRRINSDGLLVYSNRLSKEQIGYNKTVIKKEMLDIQTNPSFIKQVDTIIADVTDTTTITEFYGPNDLPMNHAYTVGNLELTVHRIESIKEDRRRTQRFYEYIDRAIRPLNVVLDTFGIAKSFFMRVEEYDSNDNLVGMKIEDEHGVIVKNMMYFIQNGQRIGRAVKGIDGTPVRCDRWDEEGYLYYKFYFSLDFQEKYTGLTAVDEWENHSVLFDGKNYLQFDWMQFKDSFVAVFDSAKDLQKLDRNDIVLATKIFKNYEQVSFKEADGLTDFLVPYFHVLSSRSIMFSAKDGVRDGDRLKRFGKWELGMSEEKLAKEWNQAMRGRKPVEVIVLRPDSHTLRELSFSFTLSNNEKSNIEYHLLRMTKEEYEFFKECTIKK